MLLEQDYMHLQNKLKVARVMVVVRGDAGGKSEGH